MRALAEASEGSVPTLYNLYGGKHQILAAGLTEPFEALAGLPGIGGARRRVGRATVRVVERRGAAGARTGWPPGADARPVQLPALHGDAAVLVDLRSPVPRVRAGRPAADERERPIFKLREEFTVWADEAETHPLLFIKSRQIVAINFAYDIHDSRTNEWIGAVQNRGFKGLFKDQMDLIDQAGQPIGNVHEIGHTILRRFIPLLTSKHDVEIGGQVVTQIRQLFRWFTKEFTVDLSMGVGKIDPRFALACALLALMREARRESGGGGISAVFDG